MTVYVTAFPVSCLGFDDRLASIAGYLISMPILRIRYLRSNHEHAHGRMRCVSSLCIFLT
jgi:hypothetical protein